MYTTCIQDIVYLELPTHPHKRIHTYMYIYIYMCVYVYVYFYINICIGYTHTSVVWWTLCYHEHLIFLFLEENGIELIDHIDHLYKIRGKI